MNHRAAAALAFAACAPLLAACSSGSPGGAEDEDLGSTSEALTNVCPPANNVLGVDVASFQHPGGAGINWGQVATARKFAFVKSTQGTGYTNPYYAGDIAGGRAAGLIMGTYGVVAPQSQSGTTGVAQAQYFLAHSSIKPGDLPPLLDVEAFSDYSNVLPEASTVQQWLTTVEAAIGRKPTVYIRPDIISSLGTPAYLGAYTIDVPNYSTCPSFPAAYPVSKLVFWQYTDAASVPGISNGVDGIRFYGDINALKTFATGAPAIPAAAGALDKVACDGIAGWAWDPNQKPKSTTVKVSYNGALGAAGTTAVSYPAADSRADLCKALGTCTHGFAVSPPRSLYDGKPHAVDAYAVSLSGGANGLLTGAPKTFTCPEIPIATGQVKRWVTSPAVLTAWKLDEFTDMAPSTDAALNAIPKAADLEAKPDCVVADDGSPSVWIIDQGKRRHVVSPASLAAWRLAPVKLAAAMVNAYPQGPNWPLTPELAKGAAAPVYMLDVAIDSPIVPMGTDPSKPGTTPANPAAPHDGAQSPDGDAPSDSSGGCSVGARGTRGASDATWLVALAGVLGALGVRNRRRASRSRARAVVAPMVATGLLALPGAASAAVTHPFGGVTEVNHGDRVLVIADLCSPGVSMRATKYDEREATPEQWATKPTVNADVAINADFFDFPGWTYVVGRARGGGQDWPAGEQNRENRSYWEFGPGISAFVEPASTAPTAGTTEIVGGHNVLIRAGKSLGPNFDGDSVITTLHRRTAIGIDATKAHVYLFASDANLDGSGIVASVVQMAAEGGAPPLEFLTNQDGGGSSQMYVRGQGQIIDSGRQVNNHLGIFARGSGAAPMCPNRVPRGAFDAAACTGLKGWAQDQDVPTASIAVHLYFGGPVGTAGVTVIPTVANIARPDLATPIGSVNHGFDVDAPYSLFDGKPHNVFAYALDSKGGTNPLVGEKALTCAPTAPASVRRHITSPTVLGAWKFSLFTDAMPLKDPVINAFGPGTDLAAAPVLIRSDDKSPEVWLVDGPYRRHVVSAASAASWHFDLTKVVTKPAAVVNAMLHGPDVRERPLLTRATSGAVYVLDDVGSLPPGSKVGPDGGVIVPPGSSGTSGGVPGAPGDSDGGADGAAPAADDGSGGGCTVSTTSDGAFGGALAALLGAVTLVIQRRRHSRRKASGDSK